MTTTQATRRDAYQEVTDKLIAAMESGVCPWQSPYTTNGLPVSMSTGRPYRGVNPMLLGPSAMAAGYTSPWWGTYKKIQELGGQVRKGERSTLIAFWKQLRIEETDDRTSEKVKRTVFMLRVYNVFNAEQADGLGSRYYTTGAVRGEGDRLEAAERIVTGYQQGPRITFDGPQGIAFYRPADDLVSVPRLENMTGVDAYYSTLFHELTHSTGHVSRLAREGVTSLGVHRRGEVYAFEELVAEMGAALLCGQSGIDSTIDNSAAYLRSWAAYLKSDPKAAVRAAGQAQKAADYVLGVSYSEEADSASEPVGVAA